eukprot:3595916-Pleurochrysis_carterae.AAC.1
MPHTRRCGSDVEAVRGSWAGVEEQATPIRISAHMSEHTERGEEGGSGAGTEATIALPSGNRWFVAEERGEGGQVGFVTWRHCVGHV